MWKVSNLDEKGNMLPLIFFGLVFILGIFIVPAFGLAWDDEWSRSDTGFNNLKYVFYGDTTLLTNNEKYHGPFLEMLLAAIEKALGLTDVHQIFLCRHYLLFGLFFFAILAFYGICKELFTINLSLLACLILLLSPRIFAESFYNSKDLGFLSLVVIVTYFSFKFLKSKSNFFAVISGLTAGMLIDVRILGIMLPMLVVGYVILDGLRNSFKSIFKILLIYIGVCLASTILFWPILWEGPVFHFLSAFAEMKKYHWDANVFFNGQSIHASKIPWYYIPLWMFVTTPLLYFALFGLGLLSILRKIFANPMTILNDYYIGIVLAMFFGPMFLVIILHSVVYDAWRHLYFIYPFFVIIAIYGLQFIFQTHLDSAKIKYVTSLVLTISLLSTFIWMVKNHPHQNVFFNKFITMNGKAESSFELDYWGLSYKQGLEYLVKNNLDKDTIHYTALNLPGKLNQYMFDPKIREKLVYHEIADDKWTYYLTNYRGMGAPNELDLIYQIKVDNSSIMGVYKKKIK